MIRSIALSTATFLCLLSLAGTTNALSILIPCNDTLNNTFVNDRTRVSVVLEEAEGAEYLWYRADNGSEEFLNVIGNGYPELPVTTYFRNATLDDCSNHTLGFFANDSNGSMAETDLMFTYDNAPPSAPNVLEPQNGSLQRTNNVILSWNPSADSCAGLRDQQAYNVSVRGCTIYREDFVDETNLTLNLPDGECILSLTAYDSIEPLSIANGNSSLLFFTVNTSGPQIKITSPGAKVYGRRVWFNVSIDRQGNCVFDAGSGNASMSTSDGFNFSAVTEMGEGGHDVVFYCLDAYNHTSNTSKHFIVDLSPPNKTVASVGGDTEAPYNVTHPSTEIKVNLSEPGSCRMSVEKKNYSQMANGSCGPANSTEAACRESLPDGQYTRYIACTDGFNEDGTGTVMEVNFSVKVYYHLGISIDTSGSAMAGESRNFTLKLNNDGNGNLTGLNLTASSNMSGEWYRLWTTSVNLTEVGTEKNVALTVSPPSSAGNASYVFTVNASSAEINTSAEFVINVRAQETAGSSTQASGGDSNSPRIVERYPDGGYLNSRIVTVSVKTDKKSACRLDDYDVAFDEMKRDMLTTDKINHTYRFSGLANGDHEYNARCRDEEGNKMGSSVLIKFVVDTGSPTTSVNRLDPDQNSTDFEVSWEGEDGLSGIESYDIQVKIDEGGWENWLTATTKTSSVFHGEYGHIYRFRSIGRDKAGNAETKIAIHEDTFTRVGKVTEGMENGGEAADGVSINLGDGITGFFSALRMPDMGDIVASAYGFVSANIIPLLLIFITLPLLAVSVRGKPAGREKTLRKHVMDEWRRIKESLK